MTAFFHHRSLVALRPHSAGRTWSPKASMNAPLLLADVVQVDGVEPELGELGDPGRVPRRGRRRSARARACPPGRTWVAAMSNCLDGREVPGQRGREDVGPPLVVGDRAAPPRRWRPRRGAPGPRPACPRRRARGRPPSIRSRCSRGWLIVISPSAHSPAKRRRLDRHRRRQQRRRLGGKGPQPGPVDRDEPVVVDHLAGEQRPDDVDALAQPGVADRLARPRLARDVLVGELAGAERDLRRPGNSSASVAAAWATIAGW